MLTCLACGKPLHSIVRFDEQTVNTQMSSKAVGKRLLKEAAKLAAQPGSSSQQQVVERLAALLEAMVPYLAAETGQPSQQQQQQLLCIMPVQQPP